MPDFCRVGATRNMRNWFSKPERGVTISSRSFTIRLRIGAQSAQLVNDLAEEALCIGHPSIVPRNPLEPTPVSGYITVMAKMRINPTDAYIHRGFNEEGSELMTVPMEESAVRAISEVVGRHNDEFDAALAPFGLSHLDMLMPEFRRPLKKSDVDSLRWLGEE